VDQRDMEEFLEKPSNEISMTSSRQNLLNPFFQLRIAHAPPR
jgi:hypothetical protein